MTKNNNGMPNLCSPLADHASLEDKYYHPLGGYVVVLPLDMNKKLYDVR